MLNHRPETRVEAWPYWAPQSSRSSIPFADPVADTPTKQKTLAAHLAEILVLFGVGLGLATSLAWMAVMAWVLFCCVLRAAQLFL